MIHPSNSLRVLILCATVVLTSGACRAQPAQENAGRMVEGPGNIRSFAPGTESETFSLHGYLEGLAPDARTWYQHVQTLANPWFDGRAPGTEGALRAGDYIASWMDRAGLEPAFEQHGEPSWFQPFDFTPDGGGRIELHDARAAVGDDTLAIDEDFVVLGNSGSAVITAPVTFVGYGIEVGEDGYSSFDDDTDLTGRIALLLRYEPLDEDGASRWQARRFSRHAGIRGKLQGLVDRGAVGIMLVNPPGTRDGRQGLEPLQRSRRFRPQLDIPAIQVTAEVATALLQAHDPGGGDLMAWRLRADDGAVTTVALDSAPTMTLGAEMSSGILVTKNIAGILPGRGSLADEWVVVGGHWDHVGYGYTGTSPANVGHLHPGADDNASGTAGVLVLAQRYGAEADDAGDDRRSILFIGFGAEEAGLYGSNHYVEHPTIPLDQVNCMINMDMIGRLRDGNLSLSGTGTAAQFDDLLPPIIEASGLTVAMSPGGTGPSDHTNFYRKDIPVLFPFTGLHDVYHTPGDEAWTVNPAGAMQVLDLVDALVEEFVTEPDRLVFTTSTRGGGRRAGVPVRLGVMPAYGADLETGVLIDSVSEDSAAAAAGFEAGDVLVSWNGDRVEDAGRLMRLLRGSKPGDSVAMVVLREGREHAMTVVLRAPEDG